MLISDIFYMILIAWNYLQRDAATETTNDLGLLNLEKNQYFQLDDKQHR